MWGLVLIADEVEGEEPCSELLPILDQLSCCASVVYLKFFRKKMSKISEDKYL